jgi:hypothetical protein
VRAEVVRLTHGALDGHARARRAEMQAIRKCMTRRWQPFGGDLYRASLTSAPSKAVVVSIPSGRGVRRDREAIDRSGKATARERVRRRAAEPWHYDQEVFFSPICLELPHTNCEHRLDSFLESLDFGYRA